MEKITPVIALIYLRLKQWAFFSLICVDEIDESPISRHLLELSIIVLEVKEL